MKKVNLALIIIWCVIGSLILGFLVFNLVWGGRLFDNRRVSGDDAGLVAELTSELGGIRTIQIELLSEECVVIPVDEDEITVKHYGRNLPQRRIARMENIGGKLKVTTRHDRNISFFNFGTWHEYSRLEIYLPRAFEDQLDIFLTSGSVDFTDGIDVSDLTIDIVSGRVNSGHEIKANRADLTIVSGNIRLNGGLVTQSYSIDVVSGNIRVEGKTTGSGEVNVVSGNVRLFGAEILNSLQVGAVSGTIEIQVSGEPSLQFNGTKVSGTFDTYFGLNRSGGHYTGAAGAEPYKKIDADIVSGTVRITR